MRRYPGDPGRDHDGAGGRWRDPGPSAFLFSNDPAHSRPWKPDWVTHRVCDLAKAAGVDLDIKGIRHYTASQLLAAGFDLGNTAARLGHSGGGYHAEALRRPGIGGRPARRRLPRTADHQVRSPERRSRSRVHTVEQIIRVIAVAGPRPGRRLRGRRQHDDAGETLPDHHTTPLSCHGHGGVGPRYRREGRGAIAAAVSTAGW
jgi:hypothetical protein